MGQFLSSFQILVPDIPAKVYEISAELPDNSYSELAHFENILADRSRGEAHRIRGGDREWYIALFGHEHEPEEVDADGITLSLEYKTTLDPENPRHIDTLGQGLRDGFGSFLTSVLDCWEYHGRGNFYEADPIRTVRGEEATYEMFRGIRTSIDHRSDSGFMLSLDPTRKFVDERTLADRLDAQGESAVIDQFGDGHRYFFFDRPEPQPV